MSSQRPRIWKRFPFLIVLVIVGLPVALLVTTAVADRLGYCVNAVLPGSLGLNTGAYVQDVGLDHATIVWRTAAGRDGSVEVTGPDGAAVRKDVDVSEMQEVVFTGLQPDTTYQWTAEAGTEDFSGQFTTAPDASGSVRFAAIGDSGTGSHAQYDIAAQLGAADPDLVLHTGDVVYRRGALCHYGPKYFAPYETLIASTPVYPVLGNHDLMASNGQAWFETFVLPNDNPEGTEEYYSFDYGPVHIVALNSEYYQRNDQDAIDRQRAWLEADLAAAESPWTIVVLHRPPFSSTDGKQSDEVQTDLAPVFADAGVDLVLAGHAHNYERTIPIDGVTYIVTGGGGADLYDIDPTDITAVAEKTHHFVQIDASPERLAITALDRDGEVIDTVAIVQ
ncbi:MAG: metallophosphoesterase [Thermomicrobiales bacterium]